MTERDRLLKAHEKIQKEYTEHLRQYQSKTSELVYRYELEPNSGMVTDSGEEPGANPGD
jgi:hypothetical protein